MQVTIYLPNEMIDRIEEIADKSKKSRSAIIQDILAEGLEKRIQGTPSSEVVSLFGSWKMSSKEAKEIRRSSGRDVRRARIK